MKRQQKFTASQKMGNKAAEALVKQLKDGTPITNVILPSTSITADGAMELAEVLATNTTVTSLDLGGTFNYNAPDGRQLGLGDTIRPGISIVVPVANNNKLGDAWVIAFAKALETNTTLIEVNLSFNDISDAGTIALAEALKINKTLKKINLNHNKISDAGAIALVEALTINKTLEKINIHDNLVNINTTRAIEELTNKVNMNEEAAAAQGYSELMTPFFALGIQEVVLVEAAGALGDSEEFDFCHDFE